MGINLLDFVGGGKFKYFMCVCLYFFRLDDGIPIENQLPFPYCLARFLFYCPFNLIYVITYPYRPLSISFVLLMFPIKPSNFQMMLPIAFFNPLSIASRHCHNSDPLIPPFPHLYSNTA